MHEVVHQVGILAIETYFPPGYVSANAQLDSREHVVFRRTHAAADTSNATQAMQVLLTGRHSLGKRGIESVMD